MLKYIKQCIDDPNLNSTELKQKTTAVYTARFTQALTHLVPSLRKCFVYEEKNTFDNFSQNDSDANKQWTDLCLSLKNICFICWNKWIDNVIVKVEAGTSVLPQEFSLEANIDYLMVVSYISVLILISRQVESISNYIVNI